MKEDLIRHLSKFITKRRLDLFEKVLSLRTRYITVVLEDIYQPHNASAVLRSCDCFGIQDIHIVENQNQFRVSPDVALGANKWLSLYTYNKKKENTSDTIHHLRKQGYRIVATSPHKKECLLADFDLKKGKTALLFGSELNGLSRIALKEADEFIKIPMAGFTESLNISVSAALIINHLTNEIRNNTEIKWQLTDDEKTDIKLAWLKNSIKKSAAIERLFIEQQEAK